VNFAQGDLMMLGGFFAFTFIGILGLNYWIGFAGAVAAMALFGMLAERLVVRPILGYPQFSIIMATIGLGYFLRSVVGMIWGTDDFKIETPNEGMRVKTIQLLGTSVPRDSPAFYFLCLGVLILTIVGTLNLLRSPTGRASVAIRDSETAARSMGVNVLLYKVKSFAISAGITGFAGCLFAHKLSFISPEMFTLQLSIEFIIVILIGGAFSPHGAVLGAIFIVMIDPFLTYLKDDVPGMVAGVAATLGAGKVSVAHIQSNVAAFASANAAHPTSARRSPR
jgi:branched-chain amino acid transport system permease protein